MSEPHPDERRADAWASAWVTTALAVSAALAVGFKLFLALGPEDTDAFESPLVLSVARQLIEGPSGLYGPFGGRNPLVLIHAPLYYRLAALAAWPLARAGLDPVWAALAAGRSLSALGLLVTLLAAARMARLDGAPGRGRAGWWAALLIGASPILGGLPVAVRADMLGIALQTTGALLVLSAWCAAGRPRAFVIPGAFAAFALAACVKQHFVAAPVVATGLLLAACWRGRLPWKPIERGLILAVLIVTAVYGAEHLITSGQMWQAVFVTAGRVGQVYPSDWWHTLLIDSEVTGRCAGLLVLLPAAYLVMLRDRPGLVRRVVAAAGVGAIGSTVALRALLFIPIQPGYGVPLTLLQLVALPLVVLACFLIAPRRFVAGRLDAALWAFLAGELVVATALFRASTGAWTNYAIQAAVFASVLTARALARAFEGPPSALAPWPIALAALAVPCSAAFDALDVARSRREGRAALAQLFDRAGRSHREFFFVDLPGENRLYGRPDLVYDYWLYPVFESYRLAEPRSIWLRNALADEPPRVIVTKSLSPKIPGLWQSLPEMGYRRSPDVGPFHIWEPLVGRTDPPRVGSRDTGRARSDDRALRRQQSW
jgi:hypothetical protein